MDQSYNNNMMMNNNNMMGNNPNMMNPNMMMGNNPNMMMNNVKPTSKEQGFEPENNDQQKSLAQMTRALFGRLR